MGKSLKNKSLNTAAGKPPKRLVLHKDRSLFCDVLQSPINLALETDQRQTRQSSDLSSNQTFDLTIPRLLQQMSYGLRLFCLQETTQNSSNGARLSKPDALFLKKQTLEKLMQAFYSVQLKNATPSHRRHWVMIALWNDLLWIHCKKRIRFYV